MTRTKGDRRSTRSAGKELRPAQEKSTRPDVASILREYRRCRRSLLLASVAISVASPVEAADWLGTVSPDWFVAGNWSPAAVPGAGIDVKINNGATSNSATIVAPGALARAVEIGTAAGQSGRLNVASGALTIGAGGLTIGNLGSGSFNISGGGTVSTSSAFVALNPGSNGTVVISGAGSKLTASQVYVGDDAGATGQVTLQNGASLVSSVTVLGYFSATASGTLTLSGSTGSTFTNSGSFTIGERGAGTFNLLASTLR